MENCVKFRGKLVFDPEIITNKQERHSEWKKSAMLLIEPDLQKDEKGITEYYAWFIRKRFGLILQKPLRGAHVTIINDREANMIPGKWEEVKKRLNGKEMEVVVNVDPFLGIKNRMGNFDDWWLTVPYEDREEFYAIREELGLDRRPYFGFHLTIGTAVNFYSRFKEDYEYPKQYNTKCMGMHEEHSEYLLKSAQEDCLNLGEMPVPQQNAN